MNTERLKEIESWNLCEGMGKLEEQKLCIMQAVDYVSGGGFTDHPPCACPILTEYSIRLNDRFNDEHRQLLKPFIPRLIETKSTDAVQIARKRLILWRNVTVTYPLILEAIKLPELAAQMRLFENTLPSMADAAMLLRAKREEICKANAYTYAKAYAYAAVYDYAYANAYAYADVYGYAKAYAYADVYVYFYALKIWRDKIAAVALETLSLAIEVTDKKDPQ